MNGKSVEVDNTDAEGRLVLSGTLVLRSSFEPIAKGGYRRHPLRFIDL